MKFLCPRLNVLLTDRKCNEKERILERKMMNGIPENWKVDYSLSKSLTISSAGYAWMMMV